MVSNCRQDGPVHLLLCAKSKKKSCIDSIMKCSYAVIVSFGKRIEYYECYSLANCNSSCVSF